jgi:hypothetical protein
MTRLRRGVPVLFTLLGLAVFAAAPADAAKVKSHYSTTTPKRHAAAPEPRAPAYVSRGVDRNPGGDNLYFTDTRAPSTFNGPDLLGPAWFQRWFSTTY